MGVSSFSPLSDHPAGPSPADGFGLDAADSLAGVEFPSEALVGTSEAWVRKRRALPALLGGDAVLLTSLPDCLETLQQAQLMAGHPLRPVLVSDELLSAAIEMAFRRAAPESAPDVSAASGTAAGDDTGIDLLSGSAPAVQALHGLLLEAIRCRASDIHFEPQPAGLRVRFRIDGGLYERPAPPAALAEPVVARLKVMAHMDIAERRLPQDGMAQVRAGGRVVDVRVSTVPVSDGERVVLRLLDRDNAWRPLPELGMGPEVLDPFSALLERRHGFIVVSGPTGSGKTTTLYSALSSLDASRRNILTVEDPVEYRLPSIGQIQVKPKIGLTFASGLRHILRQDPDVILVGETRDPETAEIAVRAALTGHLVFTTLHTNDAPSAVARLVDMGVEPYLLASCLRGVLAQRLVRRLCPHCGRAVSAEAALAAAGATDAQWAQTLPSDASFREPVGCGECLDGYRGRVGIFEYMAADGDVADCIRRGAVDAPSLREAAADGGFAPLLDDAVRKACAGTTDLREALSAVS